jgi:hypothetical protein
LREAEQQQEGGMTADLPRFDAEHKPTTVDQMMLVDDAHDQRLIENCHPPRWVNPTPSGKYNLVVLGAGTAGLVSAAGAAGLGAKVALIERNLLGGDCLNVGCVPSKGVIRAARAAFDFRNGTEFGVGAPSSRGEFCFSHGADAGRAPALVNTIPLRGFANWALMYIGQAALKDHRRWRSRARLELIARHRHRRASGEPPIPMS